jgi:hypothetical protein
MLLQKYKVYSPKWIKPHKGFKEEVYACRVSGLETDCLNYYDNKNRVWIDCSIVNIIVLLNQLGNITSFCCSGLDCEYRGFADNSHNGYICFENNIDILNIIPKSFEIEKWFDGTRIGFKRNISEKEKVKSWKSLENSLLELSKKELVN